MDRDNLVANTLSTFPAQFGLRGFPGDVFRCSVTDSYVNDSGGVTIYTERLDGVRWRAFAKGSPDEVHREMTKITSASLCACGCDQQVHSGRTNRGTCQTCYGASDHGRLDYCQRFRRAYGSQGPRNP